MHRKSPRLSLKAIKKILALQKNLLVITKHILCNISVKVNKCMFPVTIFIAHAKGAQKAYSYEYSTVWASSTQEFAHGISRHQIIIGSELIKIMFALSSNISVILQQKIHCKNIICIKWRMRSSKDIDRFYLRYVDSYMTKIIFELAQVICR